MKPLFGCHSDRSEDPAGYLFEIGIDAGSWERAKAEVKRRGGFFGSTEATYDIEERERENLGK